MNEIDYKILCSNFHFSTSLLLLLEYETIIDNLNEYKKFRIEKELSSLNADLIMKFMLTRIKLAEELKAQINQ